MPSDESLKLQRHVDTRSDWHDAPAKMFRVDAAAMREIEAAQDRPARYRPGLAALFARSRPE
jgi:hypothetical protein